MNFLALHPDLRACIWSFIPLQYITFQVLHSSCLAFPPSTELKLQIWNVLKKKLSDLFPKCKDLLECPLLTPTRLLSFPRFRFEVSNGFRLFVNTLANRIASCFSISYQVEYLTSSDTLVLQHLTNPHSIRLFTLPLVYVLNPIETFRVLRQFDIPTHQDISSAMCLRNSLSQKELFKKYVIQFFEMNRKNLLSVISIYSKPKHRWDTIDASDCAIGYKELKILLEGNPEASTFYLNNNQLQDDSVELLQTWIQKHRQGVAHLRLKNNKFTMKGEEQLLQASRGTQNSYFVLQLY